MVLSFLLNAGLMVFGAALLIKGAEWVTDSISHVAEKLQTTSRAVGLVLVSVMLSLPEIVVAGLTIAKGHSQIGLGTLIGSVIINIGLIVGVCCLIRPLRVSRVVLLRDLVFMMVATIIVTVMAFRDGSLDGLDGTVLLLLFVPYLVNVYQQERYMSKKEADKESKQMTETLHLIGKVRLGPLVLREGVHIFLAGGAMLIAGAQFFTDSLIYFGSALGVSDLILGITLGALGPSLPNLAAAVQATRRGFEELAISETIGSNIFTLLVSIGVFSVLQPIALEASALAVTLPALLFITFLFMGLTIRGIVSKTGGVLLLLTYAGAIAAELLYRVA